MSPDNEVHYRRSPGLEAIALPEGQLLLRSDSLGLRLEGAFARLFGQTLMPALESWAPLSVLSERTGVAAAVLGSTLDSLVEAQALHRIEGPPTPSQRPEITPLLSLLASVGMAETDAIECLGKASVAIFGLEAQGAHLASQLARMGVGSLLLVDPFAVRVEDVALSPTAVEGDIGRAREAALAEALRRAGSKTEFSLGGEAPLDARRVADLARGRQLLVGCFDRGFAAVDHWINQASLALHIPAVFAEIRGTRALLGPWVVPGETACEMCYRMRAVACEADFQAAMTYEEHLDARKRPSLAERPVLPSLAPYAGSLLALEVLRFLFDLGPSPLAGRLLELDGLTLVQESHPILARHDCPACGKKKPRPLPSRSELNAVDSTSATAGDLSAAGDWMVSRRTGLLRGFDLVAKDPSEPASPYVYRAEIANHRFLDRDVVEHRVCSGKGWTLEAARISALGEAVERYAGGLWEVSEVTQARRADLLAARGEDVLDPHELVLYAQDQYGDLPYAPYDEQTEIGWLRGRSLATDREVWVPALAVFMSYEVKSDREYLFPITSNGLAAGSTMASAILSAALEVIERDAAMSTWLHRFATQRYDPWRHPETEVRDLCAAYRRRGVEIELYRLPSDHAIPVFWAIGYETSGPGPAAVVGMGADFDPRRAARQAILEVGQVRPALRIRMRRPTIVARRAELVGDPRRVEKLEDHDLLYADRAMLGEFDFLRERPLEPCDWEPRAEGSAAALLERLVGEVVNVGSDVLFVDLSPSDLGSFGLHAARAILPGFQPIDFGWKERRLGGERLFELPRRLGIRTNRASLSDLNPAPHPIA